MRLRVCFVGLAGGGGLFGEFLFERGEFFADGFGGAAATAFISAEGCEGADAICMVMEFMSDMFTVWWTKTWWMAQWESARS